MFDLCNSNIKVETLIYKITIRKYFFYDSVCLEYGITRIVFSDKNM